MPCDPNLVSSTFYTIPIFQGVEDYDRKTTVVKYYQNLGNVQDDHVVYVYLSPKEQYDTGVNLYTTLQLKTIYTHPAI